MANPKPAMSTAPRLLAIETATSWCGIALWQDGPIAVRAFANHMDLSKRLVPTIQTTLVEEGWTVQDLNAIAVSIGPGSFTSLRIGVATAKTLAQTLSIPVIGIPTTDVLALPYSVCAQIGTPVLVTLRSRRDQYYARWYGTGDGEIHMLSVEELQAAVAGSPKPPIVLGGAPLLGETLPGALEAPGLLHRAIPPNLAALAHKRFSAGDVDDPMTLVPLYVGRSAAEERREAPTL